MWFLTESRWTIHETQTVMIRTLLLPLLLVLSQTAWTQTLESAQTIEELESCAEAGDAECQGGLGIMYFAGLDVPQDFDAALRWLRPAADQGNAPAQAALGLMYKNGDGLPQDDIQAYKWLQIAFYLGEDKAGLIRDFMAENMTPEDVAEAQRLAGEWKPKIGAVAPK